MSPRQWLALLCFYTAYLFFGASVFYYTELSYEIEKRAKELQERININEILVKYASPDDVNIQNEILQKLSTYCRKPVTNHTLDEFVPPYLWSFYHSVFFAFTVCSTLGYGNIAPTRTFGRYFMILYAIIGMPVNAILYTYLGDYFGKTFIGVYSRYKAYKMANNKNYVPKRWGMIAQITLYLVPASIVLIFLPSCLFTYFEGWPYSVSVYYSFVTLSTIGFGDFIPTFQPHQEREFGIYFKFYQAFVVIWFVFGLSYLLMLISFIARGMRSKRITRLEHQLSENIKVTHNRIWNGVTKDVSYLRTILNEIYMMKFKAIFNETLEEETLKMLSSRSLSCPEFTSYDATYSPLLKRKRAYSENYVKLKENSEEELKATEYSKAHFKYLMDKRKKSENCSSPPLHLSTATTELLTKVVTALSTFQTVDEVEEEDIYDNENDENDDDDDDIDYNDDYDNNNMENVVKYNALNNITLLNELDLLIPIHNSSSSMKSYNETILIEAMPPEIPRKRATSEISHIKNNNSLSKDSNNDWTWNGNEIQIKNFLKLRNNSGGVKQDCASIGRIPKIKIENEKSTINVKSFKKNILFCDNVAEINKKNIQTICNVRRESHISIPNKYIANTINGRTSALSMLSSVENPDVEVLEKTTIADLIRALESAHIKENLPDKKLQNYYYDRKIRGLGKTSLTPPATFNKLSKINNLRRASMCPNSNYKNLSSINNCMQPPAQSTNNFYSDHHHHHHHHQINHSSTIFKDKTLFHKSPKMRERRFSVRPIKTPINSSPKFVHPSASASVAQRGEKNVTLSQRRNTLHSNQLREDIKLLKTIQNF